MATKTITWLPLTPRIRAKNTLAFVTIYKKTMEWSLVRSLVQPCISSICLFPICVYCECPSYHSRLSFSLLHAFAGHAYATATMPLCHYAAVAMCWCQCRYFTVTPPYLLTTSPPHIVHRPPSTVHPPLVSSYTHSPHTFPFSSYSLHFIFLLCAYCPSLQFCANHRPKCTQFRWVDGGGWK